MKLYFVSFIMSGECVPIFILIHLCFYNVMELWWEVAISVAKTERRKEWGIIIILFSCCSGFILLNNNIHMLCWCFFHEISIQLKAGQLKPSKHIHWKSKAYREKTHIHMLQVADLKKSGTNKNIPIVNRNQLVYRIPVAVTPAKL